MKTAILIIVILFSVKTAFSQVYSKLEKVKLSAPSDYAKNDTVVIDCANFILSGSPKFNETNKLYAIQFILRWMEGTPDYTFTIGPDFLELTDGKPELSQIYIASLVKATLDHKNEDLYLDAINEKARNNYVDYCAKPENRVRKSKAVKNILKERNN
jgi:hypothetical protein